MNQANLLRNKIIFILFLGIVIIFSLFIYQDWQNSISQIEKAGKVLNIMPVVSHSQFSTSSIFAPTLSLSSNRENPTKENSSPSRSKILKSRVDFGPFLKIKNQLVSHLYNIEGVPNVKGLAFTPDGKEIWGTLLLNKKRGLAVFNAKTRKNIANINLDNGGGVEIIFNKDGSKAYVSQMETGKIFEISTFSKKILRVFNSGSTWTKVLAISSDGRHLFASNWVGNNVSEINLITGHLERLIPTIKTPRGIYLTPDNKFLYVAGFAHGEIEKIDLTTGKGKVIFRSGGAMRHIVADEQKNLLFLSDMGRDTIWKLNLLNDKVEKFVSTDHNPNTIVLSPNKNILFVSCRGTNHSNTNYYVPGPEWGSILLFDTHNGQMMDAIIGGNQPTALDISPDGRKLVFSDFLDKRLEIYNIPSYETLKSGNGGISKIYKTMLRK